MVALQVHRDLQGSEVVMLAQVDDLSTTSGPSKARRKSAGQRAKALEYAGEYAGIHRISVFAGTGEASFNVTMYR